MLLPSDGFDALTELALNLRWSWNHASDGVWRQLDAELWELTHNPWVVLQTVSRDKIKKLLADPVFRKYLDEALEARRQGMANPTWFQKIHPNTALKCTAYFSMEFMLSEALPIYSGGLGNVAGDQLKAASDLGVPVVGVGLLYQEGYFRQVIDNDGAQQALYPYNDPGQLPITALRHPNLGGAGRQGKTLSAGQQRCSELSGISRHNERTLWGRPGTAAPAGNPARRRRMAAARGARYCARGLPSKRRPCSFRYFGTFPEFHEIDR